MIEQKKGPRKMLTIYNQVIEQGFSNNCFKFLLLVHIIIIKIWKQSNPMSGQQDYQKITIKSEEQANMDGSCCRKQHSNESTPFPIKSQSQCDKVPLKLKKKPKRKQINARFEQWETQDVKLLFQLYDQFGPQWKKISEYIPERQANSIKNRFYTALRNTFKVLFKMHEEIPQKLPHEIPSKELVRVYEGRQEFKMFENVAKTILFEMKYEYSETAASKVIPKHAHQIKSIYDFIYNKEENSPKSQISEKSQNYDFTLQERKPFPPPINATCIPQEMLYPIIYPPFQFSMGENVIYFPYNLYNCYN